jgi:hypothetical protein
MKVTKETAQNKPITADMLNEAAYAIRFQSDLRLAQILYKHGIADLDRVYAIARDISEYIAAYMISELKGERVRTISDCAERLQGLTAAFDDPEGFGAGYKDALQEFETIIKEMKEGAKS